MTATIVRSPSLKQYPFRREGLAAIVLRQIQVRDDIEIGMRMDKRVAADPRGSSLKLTSFLSMQKRESVRLSIVAVLREGEGAKWERVNEVEPFDEMDSWSETSYAALLDRYMDLMSVEEEEDFRTGAAVLSSAEVVAMIGRAPAGSTRPAAAGSAEPAGT